MASLCHKAVPIITEFRSSENFVGFFFSPLFFITSGAEEFKKINFKISLIQDANYAKRFLI